MNDHGPWANKRHMYCTVVVKKFSNLVGYYFPVSVTVRLFTTLFLYFSTHVEKNEKSEFKDKSTRWWGHGVKQTASSFFGTHPQPCQVVLH